MEKVRLLFCKGRPVLLIGDWISADTLKAMPDSVPIAIFIHSKMKALVEPVHRIMEMANDPAKSFMVESQAEYNHFREEQVFWYLQAAFQANMVFGLSSDPSEALSQCGYSEKDLHVHKLHAQYFESIYRILNMDSDALSRCSDSMHPRLSEVPLENYLSIIRDLIEGGLVAFYQEGNPSPKKFRSSNTRLAKYIRGKLKEPLCSQQEQELIRRKDTFGTFVRCVRHIHQLYTAGGDNKEKITNPGVSNRVDGLTRALRRINDATKLGDPHLKQKDGKRYTVGKRGKITRFD